MRRQEGKRLLGRDDSEPVVAMSICLSIVAIIFMAFVILILFGYKIFPAKDYSASMMTSEASYDDYGEFDTDLGELEAIGQFDVDRGLMNVTLTIPAEFAEGITQEDIDQAVWSDKCKSAKINSDGSVTYVLTKAQHEAMLVEVADSINQGLADIVESGDYPDITSITANDDFSVFTVTTTSDQISLGDSIAVLGLYMYGGMYAVFNGKPVDNIRVDYVNAYTGEIIGSANSDDLGAD